MGKRKEYDRGYFTGYSLGREQEDQRRWAIERAQTALSINGTIPKADDVIAYAEKLLGFIACSEEPPE